MNPLQKMQEQSAHFTKNDRRIYDTIVAQPGGIAYMSTSELAQQCGVSQPAVTRFVKSIGYERYQDFRSDLVAYLARTSGNETSGTDRQPYFARLAATLDLAEAQLTPEYMRQLADYVLSFERIFVCGLGKSAYPAKLFSNLVRKLGLVATFTDLVGAKDYIDLTTERDVMLFFTVNGRNRTQQSLFDHMMTQPGALMLITAAYQPKKLRPRDTLVRLPYLTTDAEESSISPVLFSIFVELLVSYMSMGDVH